ncbi:MAG: hypothetical protein GWM92_05525 [Gemmatimonadetes bacterium]|nr:hypothetical protein [Gemmatimonadota bacterium]NIR78042.1 hypothetical protein [Gemmatimonadota bacterium]NIT86603.1 hypothetical protein [Gemmatimonadota bacterium]NIU30448.1 hypothetical protein [Gemmatimonadota bacterium]NIU35312.1 hypothetical protein [Gemmatimonadota bacterium]
MRKSLPLTGIAVLSAALVGWGPPPDARVAAPDPPVADAAMRDDAGAVRALLEEGADVNAAQADGMTALHWAAENGDADLAATLVHAGAYLEATTRIGDYTPLHLAARAGSEATVEALLDAGSDLAPITSASGATPLHFAAQSGSARTVSALVRAGAEVDIRAAYRGQTPLMWAAAENRAEASSVLLGAGADPDLHTEVVDIARREKEDELAEDGGRGYGPSEESEEENERPRPLSYAELVGSHGGLTALLHAAREGNVEAVLTLLDGGADIDRGSAGDGTSPLLIATINGHFDLARLLLERGADPTLASEAGATPLFAALNLQWAPESEYPQPQAHKQQRTTYLELMRALLEAGADPNARLTKHLWYLSYNRDYLSVNLTGATPFWRAAYATDVEAMKLLMEYGADPSIPTKRVPERRYRRGGGGEGADPSGLPPVPIGGPAVHPIHAASGVGYGQGYASNAHRHVPGGWLPAVRYLVEEIGADVNARDHNGYNAIHHAAARGDDELIRYLVEQGGDVTAVSRRGQTTADMANGPVQRLEPFPETVALLESLGSENNHNCVSC